MVMESAESHSQSSHTCSQIRWTPPLCCFPRPCSLHIIIKFHIWSKKQSLPLILQGKSWQTQSNPI